MIVFLVGVALAGCSGTPTVEETVSIDGPVFTTVRELADAADVVVVGVVGERLETSDAASNATQDETAAYHRFAIDDVLAGDAAQDEVLLWLALDRVVPLDRVSPLVEGSRVVVFADRVLAEEVDGGLPAPSILSPLMYDNGTLDVEDEMVTARSAWLVDLGEPRRNGAVEPTMGVALVTTLEDLRLAVGG